ncbi:BTAD domain-containing putative transcriptional regulator [Streptomyces sp. OUCMDZ-3434]|uniref:BTAD domain-containing putative transcriptional regulator n=1 Tax=Streptomyces sp. OUCMDZ-3434 TaxID=1535304 RepID=UPI003FCD9669
MEDEYGREDDVTTAGPASGAAVEFGVLGPVECRDGAGLPVRLGGPRHREVVARLLAARRRVVPVDRLVADLWEEPPPGATGAVRTFVAEVRRALEPGRRPRTPSRLLATEGPGYVLRPAPGAVDAWHFEAEVARAAGLAPAIAAPALDAALATWRGPAYADFPSARWAHTERARLTELRLHAVERRADALIRSGAPREAVWDLDAHVAEHPWREDGWHLLATALLRSGRQGDALGVLRRARRVLADQLGADPGPGLARLEREVLRQADHPDEAAPAAGDEVWSSVAAAYEGSVPARSPARLEATASLLRELAVTGAGGLGAARRHRVAAVTAAERTGDAELAARVIGVYDVPAVWTRVDDPDAARAVVRTAERVLARLPEDAPETVRARLLASVAVESRGDALADGALPRAADPPARTREPWRRRARQAADEAESAARRLHDASLLAFALNGAFLQSCAHSGQAARRDAIGAELVRLARTHGLLGAEVLGRLIRVQALAGLGDLPGADHQAAAADHLADRYERPLARVFTTWYRALRTTLATPAGPAAREVTEAAYTEAIALLPTCGMPGFATGLPALIRLAPVVRTGALPVPEAFAEADWGPYAPWVRPLLLLGADRPDEAREALRTAPRPPHDLMAEPMWCLLARAAALAGDPVLAARAAAVLGPAESQQAGAASGLLTFGLVAAYLAEAREAAGA